MATVPALVCPTSVWLQCQPWCAQLAPHSVLFSFVFLTLFSGSSSAVEVPESDSVEIPLVSESISAVFCTDRAVGWRYQQAPLFVGRLHEPLPRHAPLSRCSPCCLSSRSAR